MNLKNKSLLRPSDKHTGAMLASKKKTKHTTAQVCMGEVEFTHDAVMLHDMQLNTHLSMDPSFKPELGTNLYGQCFCGACTLRAHAVNLR